MKRGAGFRGSVLQGIIPAKHVHDVFKFRTPYISQIKLAEVSKIRQRSVPGKVVWVWLRISANSLAALLPRDCIAWHGDS